MTHWWVTTVLTSPLLLCQIIDNPNVVTDDPETLFKDFGLRDGDIQHVPSTQRLDFSSFQPNEQHEYSFENAKMNLFHPPEGLHALLVLHKDAQNNLMGLAFS